MAKHHTSPPDLTTVSGRLRWAREAWGLSSARAAAERFGWNESTYKSHEGGIRQAEGLKEATARKYARAFGVSINWLMAGTGSPNPHKRTQDEIEWEELSQEERELALRLLRAAKSA